MTHGFDAASDSVEPAARPVDVVDRVLTTINQGVVILSSIALVIASIVLTYSVFSRYFFHFSTDWQDELSVFLIVGAVFMSGAAVQAQRGHVAIEAIVGLLPARSSSSTLRASPSAPSSPGSPGPCSTKQSLKTTTRARPGARHSGFPIR